MKKNNQNVDELIFVYNADAGLFSLVSDFAHKIISPETYGCNLCKLTYGNFAMKKEWQDFINDLACKKIFLHKDEFYRKYPDFKQQRLPVVLGVRGGHMQEIIGPDELKSQEDLVSLKNILKQRLAL